MKNGVSVFAVLIRMAIGELSCGQWTKHGDCAWGVQVLDRTRCSQNNQVWVLQVLGKGAFGIVYLAVDKADNRQYACKSINKAKLVTEVGAPL